MDEVTRSDRLLKFAVEQLFVPIQPEIAYTEVHLFTRSELRYEFTCQRQWFNRKPCIPPQKGRRRTEHPSDQQKHHRPQ